MSANVSMPYWSFFRCLFKSALIFSGLCNLGGCDFVSGVRRDIKLERLPAAGTVEAGIRAVPGVVIVEHREIHPPTAWSLYKGVIHDPPYDQFVYLSDRMSVMSGVVEVREKEKGDKTLSLYYFKIGDRLPKEFIDRIRALMDRIYASLRDYAPDLPPEKEIRETVVRVRRD